MKSVDTFNLIDSSTFRYGHPFHLYDAIRADTPVYWHSGSDKQPPFWVLTRHADIQAVSRDPENFTATQGFRIPSDTLLAMDSEIMEALSRFLNAQDEPEHSKYRNLVAPFFTPRAVASVEARVRVSVDALMEKLKSMDIVDVVDDVAMDVPIKTVCAIMGVPEEDEGRVFEFTNAIFGMEDPDFAASLDVANEQYHAVMDYGLHLAKKRRDKPQDDLISVIANGTVDGKPLTDLEVKSFFSNMIAAGNETTRGSIAGAIWGLGKFPEQRQLLVDDPALIPAALNELFRWYSTTIQMSRTAIKDVEIGGTLIRKGDRVAMLYGAGNHDPAVFDNPHELDLRRKNANSHISFGYGIHHCLGFRLGTMQFRLVLEAFLKTFPNYVINEEPTFMLANLPLIMKSLKVNLRG